MDDFQFNVISGTRCSAACGWFAGVCSNNKKPAE
jgi:hypothetical protein